MAKNKLSQGTIVAFTGAGDKCWELDGGSVRRTAVADVINPGYVVSTVADRETVFYQFDIQKDLTSEQLQESVEIRMFQDAGLNPMLEYKTAFSKRVSYQDARMLTISAIAVSMGALENAITPLAPKITFVDTLLPLSSLPYALYNANVIEPKKDIFVYFQRDTLIISIFDNGEFVYGKNQDYGLKKLRESYVQLSGERIEYEEFVKILIDPSNVQDELATTVLTNIREAISNALYSVKNILLYAGRVSGITEPDRVYIGTCEGIVPGLEDIAQEILGIEGHEFIFYTSFFNQNDRYMDQMALLALLEGENIFNGFNANPLNVTPHKRPGSLISRPAGKAIFLVAASVIAAIAWPGFYIAKSYYYDYRSDAEYAKLQSSKAEFDMLLALKNQLISERDSKRTARNGAESAYRDSVNLLATIHEKRVGMEPVALQFATLYNLLSAHSIKVTNISLKGRQVTAALDAYRDTQITALLDQLARNAYEPTLQKIIKLENGKFSAELKVSIK
ncbi:MAG: hypothetical protein LBE89_03300 [Helicobacteraceae bacterium]|nr:hypothetical protein [Helicobacteraceae bacterium]